MDVCCIRWLVKVSCFRLILRITGRRVFMCRFWCVFCTWHGPLCGVLHWFSPKYLSSTLPKWCSRLGLWAQFATGSISTSIKKNLILLRIIHPYCGLVCLWPLQAIFLHLVLNWLQTLERHQQFWSFRMLYVGIWWVFFGMVRNWTFLYSLERWLSLDRWWWW